MILRINTILCFISYWNWAVTCLCFGSFWALENFKLFVYCRSLLCECHYLSADSFVCTNVYIIQKIQLKYCYKISLPRCLPHFFSSCQNNFFLLLFRLSLIFKKYFDYSYHNDNTMNITCKMKLQSCESCSISWSC